MSTLNITTLVQQAVRLEGNKKQVDIVQARELIRCLGVALWARLLHAAPENRGRLFSDWWGFCERSYLARYKKRIRRQQQADRPRKRRKRVTRGSSRRVKPSRRAAGRSR